MWDVTNTHTHPHTLVSCKHSLQALNHQMFWSCSFLPVWEEEDSSLLAAYGLHANMHAVFFKQLSRQELKLLPSAASDVISSCDRSASWLVTLLPLLLRWASHRGVAGRTNSSLSRLGGELMPGTLGRLWKRFLNWLCGKIRKKKAGKLLILDIYPPPSPTAAAGLRADLH